MGSTWKQDVRDKLKHYQYLFDYVSLVTSLVFAGYALRYAIQLYSAGRLGLSIQIAGMGLMLVGGLNMPVDRYVSEPEEDVSGEEEDGRSEIFAKIQSGSPLLLAVGLAMLIGGHYV